MLIWDGHLKIDFHNQKNSIFQELINFDPSSNRRLFSKERRAAAGELYIRQELAILIIFLTFVPSIHISYLYHFSRYTSIYCKSSRVKISNIEVLMGLRKSKKLDLGCLSSPSHFSSPDFYTLSNWVGVQKFSVRVKTTSLYKSFQIFEIWSSSRSRGKGGGMNLSYSHIGSPDR